MTSYYAIVDDKTGEAVSFGSVVPDGATPDPAVLAEKGYIQLEVDGLPGNRLWDPTTRAFVTKPAPLPDLLISAYSEAATVEARLDVIAKKLGLM